MDIRVIFFDWGGTLAQVDHQLEALHRGASELLGRLCGTAEPALVESLIEEAFAAERRACADPAWPEVDLLEVLQAWTTACGQPLTPERLDDALEVIGRNWIGALTPLPGAPDALRRLREGGYRLGLVSNCFIPVEFCRQELTRQGLAEWLDFAVFSSGVGFRKPSEKIYQEAFRLARTEQTPFEPAQALFVGDSPAYDVIAPAKLGMKTALVRCNRGIWPAEDYARAQPDLRIDAVAELPERLDNGELISSAS